MRLNYLTLFFVTALISSCFTSCKKENTEPANSEGSVSFSIKVNNNNTSDLKSAAAYSLSEAKKIVITIQNSDGSETKYTSKEISILNMSGVFYSQKIALKTGSYKLTEFALLDASGNTIFEAPLAGSLQAQNVSSPLAILFNVSKDAVTPVTVEVLSTERLTPEDFGLSRFPISEVVTFSFMVVVTSSTEDILLPADIKISNGTYSFEQSIAAIANNTVIIKDGLIDYKVTVKASGYKVFNQVFTLAELKEHEVKAGNLPLVVELEKLNISDNGLIAYYPFNGNAVDETWNGNDGTVYGAVLTNDRYGFRNKAYAFNGVSDYINVNPSFISSNNQGTFSAWIKFNDVNHVQYLGSGGNVNSQDDYLSTVRLDGVYHKISLYTHNYLGDSYVLGSTTIQTGVYYHVAMTTDGNSWKLYVNGNQEIITVKAGNNTGAWMNDFNMKNFILGGLILQEPYDHAFVNGTLDDIRIYNRALSLQEISVLANE